MRAKQVAATAVGHRVVPHTADTIVEAWAPSREQCLAEAVAALAESCADLVGARPTGRHTFSVTAGSDEQTLVAVLEEVLYVLDVRGEVPVATHLDAAPDGTELTGWFDVVGIERLRHHGSAPKGIALSGIFLGRTDDGWRCAVTVDV